MSQERREDPGLREKRRRQQALWEVYGRRCAYTGAKIDWAEDVEVDHVLPRRLVNDHSERARLLEKFGLPTDFEIEENLLNLVPTTKTFNNAKREKTKKTEFVANRIQQFVNYQPYECREELVKRPADDLIRHGLSLAAKCRDEVERRVRALEKEDEVKRLVGQFPEVERCDLPELVDWEVGGAVPFAPCFNRWSSGVRAQRGAVRLDVFVPTKAHPAGSGLLRLKGLRIRDAMIDFGSRELLRLFRGFGGPEDERPFFVGADDDGQVVQVQCVRLQLHQDEVRDLCAVIDETAPEYLSISEELERKWCSLHLAQAKRGYVLCEVDFSIWGGIVRFATSEGGLSEEQLVLRTIPVRDGGDSEKGPVAAWLHAEPAVGRARVSVCWDPLAQADMPNEGIVDDWHAERIQAWLDQQVLPSLLEKPRRALSWRGFLFGRSPMGPSSVEAKGLRRPSLAYEWKQSAGVAFESPAAMRGALLAMMNHFAVGRRYGGLPAEHLRSIYDFISGFAKRSRVPHRQLAVAARALSGRTGGDDLDVALREVVGLAASSGFASALVARAALTALFELVGGWDGLDAISDKERDRAAHALGSVYQYTRSRAYLERLVEREW